MTIKTILQAIVLINNPMNNFVKDLNKKDNNLRILGVYGRKFKICGLGLIILKLLQTLNLFDFFLFEVFILK